MGIHTLDELTAALAGWTIAGFERPDGVESIFDLVVERGDDTRRVTIHATDLGWWASDDRRCFGDLEVYERGIDMLSKVFRHLEDLHAIREYTNEDPDEVPVRGFRGDGIEGYESLVNGRRWAVCSMRDRTKEHVRNVLTDPDAFARTMWRSVIGISQDETDARWNEEMVALMVS